MMKKKRKKRRKKMMMKKRRMMSLLMSNGVSEERGYHTLMLGYSWQLSTTEAGLYLMSRASWR